MNEDIMSDYVGSENKRYFDEIVNNPMATVQQILQLRTFSDVLALQHPNCPVTLWWELAAMYPWQAMTSPSFDLMTLDDPARWVDMRDDELTYHVCAMLDALPDRDKRLFAALALVDKLRSFKGFPIRELAAMNAARGTVDYLHGKISERELSDLHAAAESFNDTIDMSNDIISYALANAAAGVSDLKESICDEGGAFSWLLCTFESRDDIVSILDEIIKELKRVNAR